MYSFGGFSSTRGGTSGQRTIDLLITEKLLRTPGQPLQEAVSFWLRHLKLAGGSVSIEDVAKGASLFQVNLGRVGPSTESNLADVGYGISQILPVIVQGLLMPPGAIYIVQQPEIHLHPDAQAGLTDFFLFLSSKGVRTIVETHSEYFLIRLRRRLSEGALRFAQAPPRETNSVFPIRVEDVSVLLTSSDRKSGSTVKELEIGPSFQFENLPKGFMDQAVQDRMALLKSAGKGHE
jgi:predicted ATPase